MMNKVDMRKEEINKEEKNREVKRPEDKKTEAGKEDKRAEEKKKEEKKDEKKEKRYKKVVYSRGFTSIFWALMQLFWFILMAVWASAQYPLLNNLLALFSLLFVIFLLNSRHEKMEYKTGWIIIVLLLPIFGVPFYIFYGDKKPGRRYRKRLKAAYLKYKDHHVQDPQVLEDFRAEDERGAMTASYIMNEGKFPVYRNSDVTYYGQGEELFASMMEGIREAEKFIFLEYFVIEQGDLWAEMLEALLERARAGVEIRILYDDFGSVAYLPKNYWKKLEAMHPNIKCIKFNRVIPFFSWVMNNRDHRKMLIVDGKKAYTGGINLSDRYINLDSPYGHWKDAGVRVEGEAVWNFTLMYLEMWDAVKKDSRDTENIELYRTDMSGFRAKEPLAFVQPHGDEPFDDVWLSESIYLDMIVQTKKKLYIFTPYLIMSNDLTDAISIAAKRGVDVRIVTPGIPDKKAVYRMTRTSYPELRRAGVKIYEYSPGFLHSKCMLSDDKRACVGTVNFDYRSLFLHFEDGVYFENSSAVAALSADFDKTFPKCREIQDGTIKRTAAGLIFDSILRVFAPLV